MLCLPPSLLPTPFHLPPPHFPLTPWLLARNFLALSMWIDYIGLDENSGRDHRVMMGWDWVVLLLLSISDVDVAPTVADVDLQ